MDRKSRIGTYLFTGKKRQNAGGLSLMLLMMLAFSQFSAAESLYVDQGHKAAIDTNVGTKEKPFKTIQAAMDKAKPGDTIIVEVGVYREMVLIQKSGITLKAAKSRQVLIKGSDVINEWVVDKDNVYRRNFNINTEQVFCDGKPLRQIDITRIDPVLADLELSKLNKWEDFNEELTKRLESYLFLVPPFGKNRDDMVPGSFYFDKEKKTLYLWLEDSSDPNGHLMEVGVRNFGIKGIKGANQVCIDGFEILHCGIFNPSANFAENGTGIRSFGNEWTIQNNKITWCSFFGMNIYGNGHLVKNNICNLNGCAGITGGGSENVIYTNNTTNQNNYRAFNPMQHAGGMKTGSNEKNVKVLYHTAAYNYGTGIWFDILNTGCEISYSQVHHNYGNGIHYEISHYGLITNNIVYNNAKGNTGIYIAASDHCSVLNNTCYNNTWGILADGRRAWEEAGLKFATAALGNTIQNNIMVNNDIQINIMKSGEEGETNISDYNLFYGSGCFGQNYNNISFPSLEKWQEATGNDKHSIVADPMFKDGEGGDFHFTKSSPAIDAGFSKVNVKLDMAGISRPQGKGIDIGAYEYSPR